METKELERWIEQEAKHWDHQWATFTAGANSLLPEIKLRDGEIRILEEREVLWSNKHKYFEEENAALQSEVDILKDENEKLKKRCDAAEEYIHQKDYGASHGSENRAKEKWLNIVNSKSSKQHFGGKL